MPDYQLDVFLTNLDRLLNEKNLSASKLCKELGYSPNVISEIKMGRSKNPSAKFIMDVAKYLNTTPNNLLLGQKEKPTDENGRLLEELRQTLKLLSDEDFDKVQEYAKLLLNAESNRAK